MTLPRVSVVVTAYLAESKPYLDLCIESIHNLNYPMELLDVVIVTPRWYVPTYENCKTLHPAFGSYHNAIGLNYGVSHSDQSSKHILLLNDDVVLTRNALIKLVHLAGDNNVILGAMSNCDNCGFYDVDFPLGLNKRQYRIDEIKDKTKDMMNADMPQSPIKLIRPPTLYLYANLIPRKVWNETKGGTTPEAIGFDESFLTSWDDTDFCMRAQRNGTILAIAAETLIWHCSGASADTTMGKLTSDTRAEAEMKFRNKWK